VFGETEDKEMRRTAAQTREHVLDVAHELFYWHGIRAVGVDRIAREAGVAPTTLYRLFADKDDLIAAYVERNAEGYRRWFDAATAADGRSVRERVLAVFDALAEQVRPDQCRGCPFLMTLAEFADPEVVAHRHAVGLKSWVRERFRDLAGEETGDRLTIVFEGVYATVQAARDVWPARQARAVAELLLDASSLT
jgi:AcrR family transcriptional regulator